MPKPNGALFLLGMAVLASPSVALSQSAWGEPIAPQATPQPEPKSEPSNPDWSDPPAAESGQDAPENPDWVYDDEEDDAPPIASAKRSASESYDLRYANRSLTMPRGMMRGTFDTVVGRRAGETVSTMSFGAAITLAQDFEIGFSRYRMASFPSISLLPNVGFGGEGLIAFSMSPDAEFGDIPLYARFEALDRDVVKLGFDAVFRIPVQSNFGFLGGIPLRFVIQEQFAIDTGLNFTVDDNPQGPAVWSVELPVKLVANATDHLFMEVASGMTFFDLGQTVRTATSGLIQGPFYFIPLGFQVGYTLEARATMMDIFAGFRFPTLYGFTARDSSLTTETWQVTIGLNIYSPILFKESAL
ncbi:MAG: hypothetical protein WAU39_16870 [Polyangiales bacterium]